MSWRIIQDEEIAPNLNNAPAVLNVQWLRATHKNSTIKDLEGFRYLNNVHALAILKNNYIYNNSNYRIVHTDCKAPFTGEEALAIKVGKNTWQCKLCDELVPEDMREGLQAAMDFLCQAKDL